ncbi:hypothetical protein H7K45_06920 [Mycobacterium yunnanensis]|uniref:Uncharacterized protein n=1 Tax=Mycobacterium yunnanensis TaxID=368477 RepID=A0A9X2YZD3_9MYCO|nr:hypothetical protein [Mycobacterium yunnanensis]MCV7420266.1 hypothetical protein [Mycobacterium yunnanensis]
MASVPLCGSPGGDEYRIMFYTRSSRIQKITRTRAYQAVAAALAGVHAANGLAHGAQPSAHSPARYENRPE